MRFTSDSDFAFEALLGEVIIVCRSMKQSPHHWLTVREICDLCHSMQDGDVTEHVRRLRQLGLIEMQRTNDCKYRLVPGFAVPTEATAPGERNVRLSIRYEGEHYLVSRIFPSGAVLRRDFPEGGEGDATLIVRINGSKASLPLLISTKNCKANYVRFASSPLELSRTRSSIFDDA